MNSFYPLRTQDVPTPAPIVDPVPIDVPILDISQIPQITIQEIAASPGFWSQPVATIFAGALAGGLTAVAAGIAYKGVMRQIHSAESRDDRARNLDALTEAAKAFLDLVAVALKLIPRQSLTSKEWFGALNNCDLARTKLVLLDLTNSADALAEALDVISTIPERTENMGAKEEEILELISSCRNTTLAALKLDTKSPARVVKPLR